jgi:hypothetical protein
LVSVIDPKTRGLSMSLKNMAEISLKEYRMRLEHLLLECSIHLYRVHTEAILIKSQAQVLRETSETQLALITRLNSALLKANARLMVLEDRIKDSQLPEMYRSLSTLVK